MPKQVLRNIQLGLISLLVLLGLMSPVHALTDLATAQSLRNKLDRHTEVGVIVTFENMGSDAQAKTPFAKRAFTSRLKSVQQSLLDQLPSVDKGRARSYQFVPQMAMRVNKQNLETLLANPNIKVAYDKPYKLLLAESVPRVFPDQQSSPYDGGNQWAVAVLDSGVDKAHPFLTDKVDAEACFSNRGGAGVPGENSVSTCPGGGAVETGTGTGEECSVTGCDHGTRVAGVAAGSGATFDGVAKAGKIISIQVTTQVNELVPGINDLCEAAYGSTDPCVLAYSSDIIAALEYVYDTLRISHNIAAVNLSLGYDMPYDTSGWCDSEGASEKMHIDNLRNVGIATVAAAGNSNSGLQISVPACVSNAIAVGATLDTADTVWGNSNSGVALDFYAPGSVINSSVPGGTFSNYSGTSMAAPHVAGAWAVIKHAKPSASVDEVEALLKAHGPVVGKFPADPNSRRRLALTDALNTLCGGGACDSTDGGLCVPLKAANGKTALICL